MKKLTAILALIALAISLVACSEGTHNTASADIMATTEPTVEVTTEPTKEATAEATAEATTEATAEATETKKAFRGLIIGISNAKLSRPAYVKDGTLYADLGSVLYYFDGNVTYDVEMQTATAFDGSVFYTFEAGNTSALRTEPSTGVTEQITISLAPIKTETGFDFPLTVLAELMKLTLTDSDGYYILKKQ